MQWLKQREWGGGGMELNDDTGRLAVADAAAEAADPEGKRGAAAGDGGVAAAGAVHAGGEQEQPAEEPEDAGHGLPPA